MPDVFVPENIEIPSSYTPPHPPHVHPFATFCRNPQGIHFQNQEPDEKILLFLRKHIVTNIPWILTTIFLALLPFIFLSSSLRSLVNGVFNLPPEFVFVLTAFYYLIVFAYAFIGFITWFYNVSLVTQKRIVDIDFSDLVYHNVAATKMSLVQDVDYTQVGVIRTFFNYGDVYAQTAGEKPNFDFLAVPQPAVAVNIIEQLIGKKHG